MIDKSFKAEGAEKVLREGQKSNERNGILLWNNVAFVRLVWSSFVKLRDADLNHHIETPTGRKKGLATIHNTV